MITESIENSPRNIRKSKTLPLVESQINKLNKFRIVANNALRMATNRCFPITLNMEVKATEILKFKQQNHLGLSTILAKSIADTIKSDHEFQILNSMMVKSILKNKLQVFEHVNFSIALPKVFEGHKVAALYILDKADLKSYHQIDTELQMANKLLLEELPMFKKLKLLFKLPTIIINLIFWLMDVFPISMASYGSSIGFTNLGKTPVDTLTPVSPKTIIFGFGGIREKPILKNGQYVPEKIITINMTLNHFVVDGEICSIFLEKLKKRLENPIYYNL